MIRCAVVSIRTGLQVLSTQTHAPFTYSETHPPFYIQKSVQAALGWPSPPRFPSLCGVSVEQPRAFASACWRLVSLWGACESAESESVNDWLDSGVGRKEMLLWMVSDGRDENFVVLVRQIFV